jgi:hypothetical protein
MGTTKMNMTTLSNDFFMVNQQGANHGVGRGVAGRQQRQFKSTPHPGKVKRMHRFRKRNQHHEQK